jgi:hypothetical protein
MSVRKIKENKYQPYEEEPAVEKNKTSCVRLSEDEKKSLKRLRKDYQEMDSIDREEGSYQNGYFFFIFFLLLFILLILLSFA